MPTITIAAGELRRIIGAEPRAPHASTQWQVGDLTVTLSRARNRWALTLRGGEPLTQDLADLWARAIGVQQPDWWPSDEGRRWQADWLEA